MLRNIGLRAKGLRSLGRSGRSGRGERLQAHAQVGVLRQIYFTHARREALRAHFDARLARHPRMVLPVSQIFGEPVYMHQFKINGKMAFDGDVWQWHQDYGTWKNDDQMPEERAMNVAIFLDPVNEFNGPLMFIPGSHKLGVVDAAHDLTTTSYPLWTIDHDTIAKLVRVYEIHGVAFLP